MVKLTTCYFCDYGSYYGNKDETTSYPIYEIPEAWRYIKFASLVNFRIGKTPPRSEATFWGTEIPWVSISDMPIGYKNFSKTKPMKSEHFNPVRDWWENREEILEGKFYKSKSFTPSELAELNYNLDQCGFPKEEEEILNPFELIQNYQAERATLNHKIDNVLADILQLLEDK
ncbi:type I restriction-modification system M protein [Streptococcus pneumoniae]|nr:type I restriction-modification system M protein [Streptococcus pneumoniae]